MRRCLALVLATALFAFLALTPPSAEAADPTKPHPHQGVIPAIAGAPPIPELTADDLTKLEKGDPVKKQQKDSDGGGRGIAIQDIHASPEVIWGRITKYSSYPTWVDGVYECEEYERSGDKIKVRFVIGAMLIRVEYFIVHTYKPGEGYMTWTLDYSRESDLDDSVGFWRVMPIPDKPGWTRVFYSVDVRLRGWVPGWVESMLAENGLTKATSWVKRESEIVAGTAAPK